VTAAGGRDVEVGEAGEAGVGVGTGLAVVLAGQAGTRLVVEGIYAVCAELVGGAGKTVLRTELAGILLEVVAHVADQALF
jgi:hypothetical protein